MFSKVRSDHMALLGPMWCASNLDVATAISFQKQWRQIILSSLYQPLLDNDECCCYRMSSCLLRWAPLPPNGIDSIAPNSPLPPLLSLAFYHHQRLLRSSEQSWWQHHRGWSLSTVVAAAAADTITISIIIIALGTLAGVTEVVVGSKITRSITTTAGSWPCDLVVSCTFLLLPSNYYYQT